MLIARGRLKSGDLKGKVALVSGAGGGIGFEAARSLIWLGARVVIAEINKAAGKRSQACLEQEFGRGVALFIHCDVGDEGNVKKMVRSVERAFGPVDIVVNNATVATLGAVKDIPIQMWDTSYRVNLRGVVLLARAILPGMIERKGGVFACISSTGLAYMGAYESLKAAQVHLGSTLSEELEGTGVIAFTIGPGFAPTRTADSAIPDLARLMGKPESELRGILSAYTLSVEAAGAGFAAAIALAFQDPRRYAGQEISSMQALIDAGISLDESVEPAGKVILSAEQIRQALAVCNTVRTTLAEQSAGWKQRSVFEQQWMVRSFRKQAGMPVEEWLEKLARLEDCLAREDAAGATGLGLPFQALANYYANLADLAKGYVKDPVQRDEQVGIVLSWKKDVEELGRVLRG